MINILFSPLKAIASAKKEKNIKKSFLVLLVSSFFISINILITTKKFSLSSLSTAMTVFFSSLVSVFVLTMFVALLLQLSLRILSGKGRYFHALTTLSYGLFIMSCGSLIASLITLVPMHGLFATLLNLLTALILLFTFIISNAVILKAATELFQTELFVVVVALLIVYTAAFLTAYLVIARILFAGLFDIVTGPTGKVLFPFGGHLG